MKFPHSTLRCVAFLLPFLVVVPCFASPSAALVDSRLTDVVLPLQIDTLPRRPRPLLEIGDPFLESGPLNKGWELPTGAVWQPSLMLFGTYRTAFQGFDTNREHNWEWTNRLDLFGNLYLTPTERILIGVRPLDENGRFTRQTYSSSIAPETNSFESEFNANITTLFFEGDFGELFPFLDRNESLGLDLAFTVGRQQIDFQDGMLINDLIDSFGISKLNMKPRWAVNYRATLLWAWHELNRANLPHRDSGAYLIGVSNEIDFSPTTVEFDAFYVESEDTGDGVYAGFGATQRLGEVNSTIRILGSRPIGSETEHNREGLLVFNELSTTPHGTNDLLYCNVYWGVGEFRSASRGPAVGGPLGPVGILFAPVQIGTYPTALGSDPDDSVGGALGYQLFSRSTRHQLVMELGGRASTESTGQRAFAGGVSIQSAFWQRFIVRMDAFAGYGRQRLVVGDTNDDISYGGRFEFLVQG